MPQVFRYRQKVFSKLLVLGAFVAIAMAPGMATLRGSAGWWGACGVLELVLFGWNAFVRITVDERGLVVRTLSPRVVAWGQVEEGTLIALVPAGRAGIIARAANKPMGPTTDELVLKLVVTGAEALYVRLGDLEDGRAFADLVLAKVRLVREKLQVPDPTTAKSSAEW